MELVKQQFFWILRWKAPAKHQVWIILLVFWLWMHVHPSVYLPSHVFFSVLNPYFLDAFLQQRVWKYVSLLYLPWIKPSGLNTYFFRRPCVTLCPAKWSFALSSPLWYASRVSLGWLSGLHYMLFSSDLTMAIFSKRISAGSCKWKSIHLQKEICPDGVFCIESPVGRFIHCAGSFP